MNSNPRIDVSDWRDAPRPVPLPARAPRRFISPAVIGVLGTILIHALILPLTYFGSRAHKTYPPQNLEPKGALALSNQVVGENLVLVTMPASTGSNPAAQLLSSPPSLLKIALDVESIPDPPPLSNLETLPLDNDQPPASTAASGDAAEQTRLFGVYTGQILARINRIWRRPRTPVIESASSTTPSDSTFQCEAQIIQDSSGNVQEILLPRCNGSPAWQRSLVTAIQQASPLPAPPSPTVFARAVTLTFVGLTYAAGANEDDYEINAPQLAQVPAPAQ